jgi:hypothetical protein
MSQAVNCDGNQVTRSILPDDWTPAPVTFQLSPDGVNWHNLYHTTGGSFGLYEVIVPSVTPGASVLLPPAMGTSISWVRLRSGTHAVPVPQAADRTFGLVLELSDAAVSGGPEGPMGPPGATGPTGPSGVQGVSGTIGATGPTGLQGTPGTPGSTGIVGPTGAQGLPGTPGALGNVGPTGTTGPAGSAGPTGPTGTASLKGTIAADDAAAGNVGEVLAAVNLGGIGFTTAVALNITTLTLPPGDWSVGGFVIFTPATTGPNSIAAGVSTVPATLPTDTQVINGSGAIAQVWSSALTSNKEQILPTGTCRINVNAQTSVYLVAQTTFGGGSVTGTGRIAARRVR